MNFGGRVENLREIIFFIFATFFFALLEITNHKSKVSKGVISIIIFLVFLIGFAQETYNLEIIWQKTGDTTFLSYGLLPTTSGDVNGDGYYDILYYGNERSWAGRAYLFYGGSYIDTIPDAVFSNSNGYDAICMGDFNGDRFDDIVIGNILDFNGYGGISIYLGSNPVDTILDYKFRGLQVGSNFGCAVASGDINGDSFGDLIVGAYGAAPRPGGYLMGQVYIYYGGPNFDTIPDVILNGGHNNDHEAFGSTVSGSGDVNNDGFSDIIIGAMNFDHDRGRIYIYLGGNPMDTIYDIAMSGEEQGQSIGQFGVDFTNNLQAFDHAITSTPLWGPTNPQGYNPGKIYVLFGGNPMDSIPDVWMIGRTDASTLGMSISSAGDLTNNFDGEIISGGPVEYNSKGTSYIWLGGASLDTIPDAWLRGIRYDDGIGWHVASAGDVDCDGKDEIMVSNYASYDTPKRVWVCKYTGSGIEEERRTQTFCHFSLRINPNPCKTHINIRYSLTANSNVLLKVYDITGKVIKTFDMKLLKPENYEVKWDLRDNKRNKVSAGIYFLEISAEQGKRIIRETRSFTVLK